jgi:hypothetical protein
LQDGSYSDRLLCSKWSQLNVEPGIAIFLKATAQGRYGRIAWYLYVSRMCPSDMYNYIQCHHNYAITHNQGSKLLANFLCNGDVVELWWCHCWLVAQCVGLLHLNIVTFGSKSELRSVGMMSARAGLAVSGVIAIGMFRRACYYVTVRHIYFT